MTTLTQTLQVAKNRAIRRIASAQIAGEDLLDALHIAQQARSQGMTTTISPWKYPGESSHRLLQQYKDALTAIRRFRLDSHLSMKPRDILYDPPMLDELITLAALNNTFLQMDSQEPEGATPTLKLLEENRSRYPYLGCTIPSRWKRSLSDADWACELGVGVRVVKGQWVDPSGEVSKCREMFLLLVKFLAGRARHVSVATHDASLAVHALDILHEAGTACELEQLWGLPRVPLPLALQSTTKVRLYIPYGYGYLPYRVRDLRQRPAIIGWMLHDLMFGEVGGGDREVVMKATEQDVASRTRGKRP